MFTNSDEFDVGNWLFHYIWKLNLSEVRWQPLAESPKHQKAWIQQCELFQDADQRSIII
jgi:hypothetical protein